MRGIPFLFLLIANLALASGDHADIERQNDLPSSCPANQVVASPNGSTGKPKCRALVAADVPAGGAPAAHGSTHNPAGSDPLTYAAPAVIDGTVNGAGIADSVARSDHRHGPVPNTGLQNSSVTIVAGTGAQVSGCGPVSLGGTCTVGDANTAVTPGSYPTAGQISTYTVNQQGRIVAGGSTTNGSGLLQLNPAGFNTAGGSKLSPLILPSGTAMSFFQLNPTTASTTDRSNALAANSGTNSFTGLSNPTTCREITVTFPASWDGGDVTVNGTDCEGVSQSRTVTAGTSITKSTFVGYSTLTTATKGLVGTSANTATIGTGPGLGVPTQRRQISTNLATFILVNGVIDYPPSHNSISGFDPLVIPPTPPNGARSYSFIVSLL